jgi:hypothetical protein
MENHVTEGLLTEDDFLTKSLILRQNGIKFFHSLARWARYLSILGFVGIGLMVIGAIYFSLYMAPNFFPGSTMFIGFGYLLVAALYFMPCYYLYTFSSYASKALLSRNSTQFEQAIEYLKSHYKYIGITSIVFISFYLIVLILALTEFMASDLF